MDDLSLGCLLTRIALLIVKNTPLNVKSISPCATPPAIFLTLFDSMQEEL
jgi:hypothetical protein